MGKKYSKRAILAFIVGIILGLSTMSVFAGYAFGISGYYGPVLGYYYENQNMVSVNDSNGYVYAMTSVYKDGSGTVPTGYMGAQARLYKDGALAVATTWSYNTSSSSSHWKQTSATYYGTGVFYSKGSTQAFNGSGYYQYSTFQSPNQSYYY